jgi:hypothetical protein
MLLTPVPKNNNSIFDCFNLHCPAFSYELCFYVFLFIVSVFGRMNDFFGFIFCYCMLFCFVYAQTVSQNPPSSWFFLWRIFHFQSIISETVINLHPGFDLLS